MKDNDFLGLLNDLDENTPDSPEPNRFMIIDGLNLFFRNFSAINAVNVHGTHIGGLGGFFRSLGFLIKTIDPTHIYMIFDGRGGSDSRKNLISEYKSGRHVQRITNWDVFADLEEEDDAKYNQLTRVIQYLKVLPVKTTSIEKVEADDIIAYLSKKLLKDKNDKTFIVSSDKDYLQLITDQITVYRPTEKEFYTVETMKEKFNMPPCNFILYKMLMGDSSDKVSGIKGLGEKGLLKRFPELTTQELTFDDILSISESKLKEHIVYARVLHDIELLRTKHKIMDLQVPMIDESDEAFLDEFIKSKTPKLKTDSFLRLYNADKLGNLIRNPEMWVKGYFTNLK